MKNRGELPYNNDLPVYSFLVPGINCGKNAKKYIYYGTENRTRKFTDDRFMPDAILSGAHMYIYGLSLSNFAGSAEIDSGQIYLGAET